MAIELSTLPYPTHGKIRKHNILSMRITTDSKRHTTEMSRLITEEQLKNKRNKSMESKDNRLNTDGTEMKTDQRGSKHSLTIKSLEKKKDKKSLEGSEFNEWKKSQSSDKMESFSAGSVKDPVEFFNQKDGGDFDKKIRIPNGQFSPDGIGISRRSL